VDEVVKVVYNWCADPKHGETYDTATLGVDGVILINYINGNDRHYCDIWIEDGSGGRMERVFNLNKVIIQLPLVPAEETAYD